MKDQNGNPITLAYVLGELADWLEHRTGGDEPRDQSRIELARAARKHAELVELALAKSVELQAHYAGLLNQHDGGERRVFDTVEAWLERLRSVRVFVADAGGVDSFTVQLGREGVVEPPADQVEQKPCSEIRVETDVMAGLVRITCPDNSLHAYQIDPREGCEGPLMTDKVIADLAKIHGWDPLAVATALDGITLGTRSFRIPHPNP